MVTVWFSQEKNPVRGAETLFICFKEYFRPKRPSINMEGRYDVQ